MICLPHTGYRHGSRTGLRLPILVACWVAAAPSWASAQTVDSQGAFPSSVQARRSASVVQKAIGILRERANEREGVRRGAARRDKHGRILPEGPETGGLDYLEAYQYYYSRRAFPRDQMDASSLARAAVVRDGMAPENLGLANGLQPDALTGPWKFIGPNNLDVPYQIYYGQLKLSGRINASAFSPVTPGTIYAGSAGGGLWITHDTGAHWTPVSDKWPTLNVSSVAVSKDGKTVLVGTGDFDGGYGFGAGIMRSTDSGVTWKAVLPGTLIVNRIVFDPDNALIVLATAFDPGATGTGTNIYRSIDGGATWKAVLPSGGKVYRDLTVGVKDAAGKRAFYANNNGASTSDLLTSTDHGATWTRTTPGFGFSFVAASPNHAGTIYFLGNTRLRKTVDGGKTFTDIMGNFENGGGNYNWSQYGYDSYIRCSTRKDSAGKAVDVVYVGLIDVEQSEDEAATWRSIGGPTFSGGAILHNDQHCIAINPTDPGDILIGNDGGLFHLTYNSSTSHIDYASLSPGLGITQFYQAAFDPTDRTKMVGGTQDNASPASTGDPANWLNVGGGDGGYSAIDQQHPLNQYVTAQFLYIFNTTDGWQSEGQVYGGSNSAQFIAPILLDPGNQAHLYFADASVQMYDAVSAQTTVVGSPDQNSVAVLEIAPSNSAYMYAATVDSSYSPHLYGSSNGGKTWINIVPSGATVPFLYETSLHASPRDPNTLFVTFSGNGAGADHVYRCTGALSGSPVWTDVGHGLPDISANSIALDPSAPATNWFVGTDVGVFYTSDSGTHWQNATAPLGLPNVTVNEVKVMPRQGVLYAATFGRGIWRLELPKVQGVSSLTTAPPVLYSGITASGNVTLNLAAGASGQPVTLTSSNPAIVKVPGSVTVKAGQTGASFPLVIGAVTKATAVTLTATAAGHSDLVTVTVQPTVLDGISLASTTVKGGGTVNGSITLLGTAPAAGSTVRTFASALVAHVPTTVKVPAGKSIAAFSVQTSAVTKTTTVSISAAYNGVTKRISLTITP